jgi:hypothetical protein
MIPWPKSFNTLFNAFDMFNLKLFTFPGLACMVRSRLAQIPQPMQLLLSLLRGSKNCSELTLHYY